MSPAPRRAVLALLVAALPALASEVWSDGQGASLELKGFAKNLLSGVLLQPDLLTQNQHRASLLAQVGQPTLDLPTGGLVDAQLFRVQSKFRFQDKVELDVAWQLQLTLATDPVFASAAALTGTVGGTSAGAQRRLVEGAGTLGAGSTWRADHNLDRLALKLALPFGDLTLGRQVLSWGTGRFWNPTDVLSPFPPTVVDREVRRGFDAARLAIALGDVTQLDLLYLPQQDPLDMGGVARFQTNFHGWDGSVSVGKYVRDVVVGADVVGDLGPVGVHAEGAYTVQLLGLGTSSVSVGDHFFRGVVGAEVKPLEKLIVSAEYSYNGWGTTNPALLASVLSSARVVRGEVFGAGRHQGAVAVAFSATDLLSLSLSALMNLADPSALLIPSLEYTLSQAVLVRAGAYVPLGASPVPLAYSKLTAMDVATNSPAFQAVTASRGLRSEYGASSFGAFVQIGVYLQ